MSQERREIEKALLNGDILGVAATNALELGVDVGGLDMTMHLGFQGDHLWTKAATAHNLRQSEDIRFIDMGNYTDLRTVNCTLSTLNCTLSIVNCQLYTVNSQVYPVVATVRNSVSLPIEIRIHECKLDLVFNR
jgi:hypothetical protein